MKIYTVHHFDAGKTLVFHRILPVFLLVWCSLLTCILSPFLLYAIYGEYYSVWNISLRMLYDDPIITFWDCATGPFWHWRRVKGEILRDIFSRRKATYYSVAFMFIVSTNILFFILLSALKITLFPSTAKPSIGIIHLVCKSEGLISIGYASWVTCL